jgi:hypothetical protein
LHIVYHNNYFSDKPFGGCNVILAGDFFQLPPTSGNLIIHDALKSVGIFKQSKVEEAENVNFPKAIGVELFKKFVVYQLEGNMRNRNDSYLGDFLATLRDFSIEKPITMEFLASIKELCKADIDDASSGWSRTKIVTTLRLLIF